MKRLLILWAILGLLQLPLFAQDSTTAAAIAERQAAEERYKNLRTDVAGLLENNLELQKKISALDAELQKLREEQVRAANKSDMSETVKKLADAIEDVDKKRESDKKEILKEIGNLGKKLSTGSAAPRIKADITPETNPGPDKGYPYTIQSGDTLLAVLSDFNAQFKAKGMKAVTMNQVTAANPNVDWKRLKIGQKIFIPAPE